MSTCNEELGKCMQELAVARAQLDVANAAINAAVSTAQWQARTNHELNQLSADNERLREALKLTVEAWTEQFERNGHTAPDWVKKARAALVPNLKGKGQD